MIALVDLPSRRNEAWKYSDLGRAMNERVQIVLKRDRGDPIVADAEKRGGIIGALAAQAGNVETLSVGSNEDVLRVDRPTYANLELKMLDAEIAPGGKLTRVVIQSGVAGGIVLDTAHVRVGAGGVFRQFVLAEGANLARVETHVLVAGEGAQVELNGAYMVEAGRHADLTSIIRHDALGGNTRQLIKGVACKGGRGVFQGKIVVAQGAQKTDARQYHHGLLLEEGAEIFAKPELMIHADDVQCAHGNTAGGLDETALFYLRSRGVPEAQARALLIEAFLAEAIPAQLPADMQDQLRAQMVAWLERGA